jgi:hypothetical protein
LKSPADRAVKALAAEIKVKAEGTIHILELGGLGEPRKPTEYSVTFAPYTGPGGAVPSRRFHRPDQLKAFLEDQVGIARSSVEEAFSDLHRKGSASIFHVQLTRKATAASSCARGRILPGAGQKMESDPDALILP